MKKKKKEWKIWAGRLFPLAAATAVLLCFTFSLGQLEKGHAEEDMRQLEETLRRGCVACYAAEGSYPPSLEYLKEHYGIQVDEERYTVRYDAFAQNLMPDITVLENKP